MYSIPERIDIFEIIVVFGMLPNKLETLFVPDLLVMRNTNRVSPDVTITHLGHGFV